MNIAVDSNKIFSAAISEDSEISKLLFKGDYNFHAPYMTIIEIFKYKEKIIKLSKKSESEVLLRIYEIFIALKLVNESDLSISSRAVAYDFCKDIDIKDVVFVALSLEFNMPIWTGDNELKNGLRRKGFDNFFEP